MSRKIDSSLWLSKISSTLQISRRKAWKDDDLELLQKVQNQRLIVRETPQFTSRKSQGSFENDVDRLRWVGGQ